MNSENPTARPSGELPSVDIDRTLAFVRPSTISAYRHWMESKNDRAMPARADIKPSALRDVLPRIGLVDVPADGGSDYVIRLAGDAIQRVFGPITGRPLPEVLPVDVAGRWTSAFDEVVRSAAPLRFTGRVSFQQKSWLQYELFMAPLGEDAKITMLFGTLDIWPADGV